VIGQVLVFKVFDRMEIIHLLASPAFPKDGPSPRWTMTTWLGKVLRPSDYAKQVTRVLSNPPAVTLTKVLAHRAWKLQRVWNLQGEALGDGQHSHVQWKSHDDQCQCPKYVRCLDATASEALSFPLVPEQGYRRPRDSRKSIGQAEEDDFNEQQTPSQALTSLYYKAESMSKKWHAR